MRNLFGMSKDDGKKLSEKTQSPDTVKYEKPKILLMDLPKDVFNGLKKCRI